MRRGLAHGIRSFLVGDLGVLATLGRMRDAGDLPPDLVLKTSVLLPVRERRHRARAAGLGATTINVSTDLSRRRRSAEIRAACTAPLDVYVEAPDDQGGFVRLYEVPDMIRVAAPLYVKLGLRNAPNIYPAGLHLEELAVKLGRERVRRAELVLRLLAERAPELVEGRGATTPRPTSRSQPMSALRLRPLRRAHLRLLRHPDRLGARDPERAAARARAAGRRRWARTSCSSSTRGTRPSSRPGRYLPYREVLAGSLRAALRRSSASAVSDDEPAAFAAAVGAWPAFHDTAASLRRLQDRFRLGVITNCDRDLFARSNRRLGVTFDWVVTAEDAGAYKPSLAPFELAFATIDVPRERILHVAQSLFHDHVPAKELGLTTVWVDRRHDREGFGATPEAAASPT